MWRCALVLTQHLLVSAHIGEGQSLHMHRMDIQDLSVSQGIAQREPWVHDPLCLLTYWNIYFQLCQWVPVSEINVYILGILMGLCLSLFISAHIATCLNNVKNQIFSCLPHILKLFPFLHHPFLFIAYFLAQKTALVNSKPQPRSWLTSLYRWIKILGGLLCNPISPSPSSLVSFSSRGPGAVKKVAWLSFLMKAAPGS